MNISELRKTLLKVFIWFLVATALIAIIAVLTGSFGEFVGKIVISTISISAASLCAMSCAAFVAKRGRRAVGITGVTLAWTTAAMVVCGIWFEISDDDYLKVIGALGVSAGAIAHACLLTLPDLDARHRWAQPLAAVCITTLALQLDVAIVAELFDDDHEVYLRLLAAVAIITGVMTLTIPILMKLRKGVTSAGQRLVLERVDGERYKDANGTIYDVTVAGHTLDP